MVVSGSIVLNDGRELRTGDWMFVPAGVDYSFRGGLNSPGGIIYHCYG
jgi:mannose-6-phosphate isomerase-like protein (cupin superfamily)